MIRTAIINTARIMRCFAPVVFAAPLFDVVQGGAA
jgi:hypothetical protein